MKQLSSNLLYNRDRFLSRSIQNMKNENDSSSIFLFVSYCFSVWRICVHQKVLRTYFKDAAPTAE